MLAPVNRAGPPASSTTMWAESTVMIDCHGCTNVARPEMFAPVPPQQNSTSTGASKSARRSWTAAVVQGSSP